ICLSGCIGIAVAQAAKPEPKKEAPKEAPVVPAEPGLPEIITLFNGKDIKDWEGDKTLWSVVDGEIVGKNTNPVKVSTYLLPKKGDQLREFADFRLTAQVKLVTSEMHSGIAFWGKLAPEKGDPFTYAGLLVMFPSNWGMFDLYG